MGIDSGRPGQAGHSGGLTSANVAQAIAQVRPYAVDVSGGVEKSKGIKDREKILAFMSAVHGT